ncbi:peptidase C14, caspase domain-containing protein, partial [Armillaria nabsnona]
RIYAVVIGIDNYSSYPLSGCGADALEMEKCLVEVVGVPKERIQALLGLRDQHDADVSSIPSHANILSTFHSLLTKADIKHGDPIVVYFAGHGSRYAWSDLDDDKDSDEEHINEHSPSRAAFVEALCPIDRDTVPDISDRELNTIFSQIYRTGGHPITVILDCCHGGGAT